MLALLSAHMIIFWLSQDSNVTPPVALASFTAAAIAKAPPMATGLASWKLAKGLYIVPVMFAYTPLLSGNWSEMLPVFAIGLVGIYGLSAGLRAAWNTGSAGRNGCWRWGRAGSVSGRTISHSRSPGSAWCLRFWRSTS